MSQVIMYNDNGAYSAKPHKPPRTYSCSQCPKTFKRSEHCSRHERGHTHEKPFQCRFCDRRYARKDLVNRHEKSFHPHGDTIVARSREERSASGATDHRASPVQRQQRGSSPPLPNPYPTPNRPTTASENSMEMQFDRALQEGRIYNDAGRQHSALLTALDAGRPSDLTVADIRTSSENGTPPSLDQSAISSIIQYTSTTSATTDNNTSIELASTRGQSNAGEEQARAMNREPNAHQSISGLGTWHAQNDKMWSDVDDFAGQDFAHDMSHCNIGQTSAVSLDQHVDGYFNTLDMLSMGGKPGIELDTDVSAYLFSSGFTPEFEHMFSGSPTATSCNGQDLSVRSNNAAAADNVAREVGSGTHSSAETFTRMPSVMREMPRKVPLPLVDPASYSIIVADIKSRLPPSVVEEVGIPSSQDLQLFLKKYFVCYHRHCPVIHIPSFDPKTTPCHLVLAICAIGALYRLSRKTARELWSLAHLLLEQETADGPSHILSPSYTASVQSRLLLGMFAIFSGDMTERSLSTVGFWSTDYRLRKAAITMVPYSMTTATWEEWLSRETSKRLLYGTFIMGSLISVTYDLAPWFSVTEDLEIETLDAECLWEASDSEHWDSLRRSQPARSSITVRDAMTHLLFGKEQPTVTGQPIKWTAFATTMVFHAVNIHMWNIMQCTQSLTEFAVDEQTSKILKAALVSQTETALARCYALLTADRSERDHSTDDPEGPLIFNCLALLRSAYVRVFTGAGTFDRMMLLSNNPVQIGRSIEAYISREQERSAFLTRAVEKAFGGLATSTKAGYLLVQKTAALSWSIEHVVAAWDCAIFVTKWIHTMEIQQQENPPNEEELKNLISFRELLQEVDGNYNGCGSLAAEITRVWACLFDDTWVWGITPRMGQVLRKLSEAFGKNWRAKFPQGNSAGRISR